MRDDVTTQSERGAAGGSELARFWAVLIGVGVAVAALAALAGLAALLLWVGVPGGKRVVAAIAAGGMLAAIAAGAWAGTGRTRPPGPLVTGGLVPVLAIGTVLLVAWRIAAPVADFRSVAIAVGWLDAPNLGTGPTEALHRLHKTPTDAGAGDGDLLGTAETMIIESMIVISTLVLASIAAGVLGAAMHRWKTARAPSSTVRRQARPSIVILVTGVVLLVALTWPSVWATANAVVDFDQSAGPEIGVSLSEVVGHPEAMWGETVTVSAAVQRVVGPHAAVIGNDARMVGSTLLIVSEKPLGEKILVPGRTGAELNTGDVVQVTGTVRARDSNLLRQELGGVLDEVRAGDYEGQVVLVVDAIDKDVPIAAGTGDPEGMARGTAAHDTGVTIDDIVHHPEAYLGLTVTVSGEIEEPILTPHVFVLSGLPLLVISPEARPELFIEATAFVTGEVRIFHLAEVEEELGIDLDDTAMRPYEGQPFILLDSLHLVT